MKIFFIISILSISHFLIGCNSYTGYYDESFNPDRQGYLGGFEPQYNEQQATQGYWDGDGITGKPKIRINLDDQRAYYYKDEILVGMSPVSTGIDGHDTPRGRFKITQKEKDHSSSLYGVIKNKATGEVVVSDADTRKDRAGPGEIFVHAPMPYFMRFNGTIGMHAGFLPGYPASHGCIRMPKAMAKKFYDNTPSGTLVIVE